MQSSKAWFFRLFANGKTFAPSASEVKAHDLRGLNYYPLLKVFCELFFKKAKIFIFVTSPINQNLKQSKRKNPVTSTGFFVFNYLYLYPYVLKPVVSLPNIYLLQADSQKTIIIPSRQTSSSLIGGATTVFSGS